jgi:lycopene cyclase domain-containing protein
MTYIVLNLLFLLTAILFLPKKLSKPRRAFWITLLVVIVLTAMFDPIIIALDIVDYDTSKTLGITWFGAPVEDFFYAVYSVIIVPLIWHKLGESRHATKTI